MLKKTEMKVPEMPKKTNDINAATKKISTIPDYSNIIATLSEAQTNLENSIKQLKQVTNPSEDFVVERLKQIKSISGVEAVTEKTDTNRLLNKNGGYTACVYFSSKKVKQDYVYAKKRESYLASFDGNGMMDSGSHIVLGTVLIRTSSQLTATQQKNLTEQISNKFTELQ